MKIGNFLLLISVIFLVIGCVQPVAKKPVAKKTKEYDEGFLVKKSLGVSSAKDLDGASVCAIEGSKEKKIIEEYFKNNGITYEIVTMENNELFKGYQSGRCDTILVKLNVKMPDSNSIILELK
jgi:hypothetical protein